MELKRPVVPSARSDTTRKQYEMAIFMVAIRKCKYLGHRISSANSENPNLNKVLLKNYKNMHTLKRNCRYIIKSVKNIAIRICISKTKWLWWILLWNERGVDEIFFSLLRISSSFCLHLVRSVSSILPGSKLVWCNSHFVQCKKMDILTNRTQHFTLKTSHEWIIYL